MYSIQDFQNYRLKCRRDEFKFQPRKIQKLTINQHLQLATCCLLTAGNKLNIERLVGPRVRIEIFANISILVCKLLGPCSKEGLSGTPALKREITPQDKDSLLLFLCLFEALKYSETAVLYLDILGKEKESDGYLGLGFAGKLGLGAKRAAAYLFNSKTLADALVKSLGVPSISGGFSKTTKKWNWGADYLLKALQEGKPVESEDAAVAGAAASI